MSNQVLIYQREGTMNISAFPGQVYGDVKTQAAMTFAVVLLVLASLAVIAFFVRLWDKVT